MSEGVKLFGEYFFLFTFGGLLYNSIELVYRLRSHWSMFILGGICFILCGLINHIFIKKNMTFRIFLATVTTTLAEFITGCIVNIWLKYDVWDYSDLPFNFMGQICLQFIGIWVVLVYIAMAVDIMIRQGIFHEVL